MNASGNPADVQIGDCTPVETSLLTAMPQTRAFLRGLGLDYMWVRLAKLGTNSYLWEHRDYTELDQVERYRLHVPVLTNSSALLVTGGSSVLLTSGGIWRLTPTYAHGVCNLLGPERIHLIGPARSRPPGRGCRPGLLGWRRFSGGSDRLKRW